MGRKVVNYLIVIGACLKYSFQLRAAAVTFIPAEVAADYSVAIAFDQAIAAVEAIGVFAFVTRHITTINIFQSGLPADFAGTMQG